jgi:hypothetical protein
MTSGTLEERIPEAAERSGPARWVARILMTLLGLLVGTSLGFFITVAIFVGQARRGIYLFSLDDLSAIRWEALPTYLGAVVGAWAGWRGTRPLVVGVGFGLAGALLLIPVGWFAGSWLWPETSGPWAGATLAAALGLLAGAGTAAMRRVRAERE